MLKRERHTFSEVAVLTDTILIVRAADRHIPGYIGGALRGSWLNTKR